MISRRNLFVSLVFILAGCTNTGEVIVDLSGGIITVFILLVLFKYLLPKIQEISLIKRFVKLLHDNVRLFIVPLYIIAIILIIVGFSLGGINKVLVISGLVVALIAEFLRRFLRHEKQEDKKLMLDIVLLGIGFLFVLMLMWGFGEVMFSVF